MQRSSRCDSKQRSKKLSVCICTKPRPRRERTEGTDAGVNSSQEPLCFQSCCNLPLLGSRLPPDKTPWCLVGNGGTDPYSSPYTIPHNSPTHFPHSLLSTREKSEEPSRPRSFGIKGQAGMRVQASRRAVRSKNHRNTVMNMKMGVSEHRGP